MIKPTKYTNVNLSVIGLSTAILSMLKEERVQKYDQILGRIKYKNGKQGNENFLLALTFLYSLGKIRYYQEEDAIELLSS